MRNRLTAGIITALVFCLTGCGGLSSKVLVVSDTVEVGSAFEVASHFECKDGVAIELKEGSEIDTSKLGDTSAIFVITSGNKKEEKEYAFRITDTLPPQISANNISLYTGREFDPSAYATCVDNSGETIVATVKSNDVDTSQPGEYTVVYEASDSTGNTTEHSVTVNVIAIETADDVMDLVDEYLNKNGVIAC